VVITHRRQIPFPEPGSGQLENAIGAHAPNEFSKRPSDGPGVRALTAQPDRLFQEILVKHKICTLHAHKVRHLDWVRQAVHGADISVGLDQGQEIAGLPQHTAINTLGLSSTVP
jgi:hypothetical protein